ncbi:hypothetical protein CN946_00995 [Bacillus sp. AFS053548]|nr:hypothetical protein CN946_00995 [Bacillus sp. AFS053548]
MNKLKSIVAYEWKSIGAILLFSFVIVSIWSEHHYDYYFWLLIISLVIYIFRTVFKILVIYKSTDL